MIVADTHVLLWLDGKNMRLGARARELAEDALTEGELVVSAITFCEVAVLQRAGRLKLDVAAQSWRADLLRRGLLERAVDGALVIEAVNLRRLHKDPADRIILATAIDLDADLMTVDQNLLAWSGPVTRIDAGR